MSEITTDPDVEIVYLADLPEAPDGFEPCEEGDDPTDVVLDGGARGFVPSSVHHYVTWLPAAFKKWGVKYRIAEGAENRGRPTSTGQFNPDGLLIHHTGTKSSATNPNPSLRTLIEGRSDLTGPLCQTTLGFDGVTTIVAMGRANHAGKARATMGNPAGDGNAMYVGNEVATDGLQDMPDVQYDALVLSSAAILDHYGYKDASKLGLHHTTSLSGKWDLGAGTGTFGVPYSITRLRADVTARLKAGPPGAAAPTAPVAPKTRWLRTDVVKMQALLEADRDGKWGPDTDRRALAFRNVAHKERSQTVTEIKVVQAIVDVKVDGRYGPITTAAVKAMVDDLQRIFKVTADHSWGPNTDRAFLAFRTEWRGK